MSYLKSYILLIWCILLPIVSYASSCPGQKWTNWSIPIVQEELRRSEVVFLGEVLTSDGFNYSMRVLDVFKGKVDADTVYGFYRHKCYLPPTEGIWIVYSKFDNTTEGLRLKDLSSLSRSLSHPLSNNIPEYPAPPTLETRADSAAMIAYNEKVDEFILERERRMLPIFLKNWFSEFAILSAFKQGNANKGKIHAPEGNFISYIALGVACGALLIVLLKK